MKAIHNAQGLEGNPAITGEIFTDNASYIQSAGAEVEKLAYTTARNESLRNAVKNLKNTTVEKQTADGIVKVRFNRKGFEHIQHDYFPDRWIRDVVLQKIDTVLKSAEYVGEADVSPQKPNEMVNKFYYYRILLQEKEWFLNVRKLKNGEAYLYSMTDRIRKE